MRSSRVFVITGALALAAAIIVVPTEVASAAPRAPTWCSIERRHRLGPSGRPRRHASSGVTQVQFELTRAAPDSVIVTATPTLYGWLAEFNSTTVPNGTYSLQSVATTPLGEPAAARTSRITVNNSPGTIVATKDVDLLKAMPRMTPYKRISTYPTSLCTKVSLELV